MTEKEVGWELGSYMRTHGADGMAFDVHVASGPGSAEPHHVSSERQIAESDPVWIDMGAKVNGYHADLTRSFVLGEPDEQFRKVYAVVLAAQLAAERALKTGTEGKALHGVAHAAIRAAGMLNDLRNRPLPLALLAFIVGTLFGWWILGWVLFPVVYKDADPHGLSQSYQEQYIASVADSYAVNQDATLARQRLQSFSS